MSAERVRLYRSPSHEGGPTLGRMMVGSKTVWTLEDPFRLHKVFGETRIPAGNYDLKLRNRGGMNERYANRFPNMHKGMIWLQDVPYFDYVYIHIGNTMEDTEGCILVGKDSVGDMITHSAMAYEEIYEDIVDFIEGDGCVLEIIDA